MQKYNKKSMDDYIRFFKDKKAKTPKTDDFIKGYQQKSTGYILFAKAITKNKRELCDKNQREYFDKLTNMDNTEIASLLGVDKNVVEELNPLKIILDKEKAEPNQKWHLFISWFGWKKYENKKPTIASTTCPELWLWMFEVSGIYTDKEMRQLVNCAENYRKAIPNKDEANKQWNEMRKGFRIKLEKEMDKKAEIVSSKN